MALIRYPEESLEDYMLITAHQYRSRGRGGDRFANDQDNGVLGQPIIAMSLPIPDLPNMASQQSYGQISGAFNNILATGLGQAYSSIDKELTSPTEGGLNVETIANDIRAQATGRGGPVVREMAAGLAARIVGLKNGIEFQSLATGEFTNPNIELLYGGPTLRAYSMNWTFAPKSQSEAQNVYEIVREFKKNHLPSSNGGGNGMLKVPSVFSIKVYVKGAESPHYQKFFPCVLAGVAIKQDAQGSHMTLPGGQPVVSSMSLTFKEIKICTASNFENNI